MPDAGHLCASKTNGGYFSWEVPTLRKPQFLDGGVDIRVGSWGVHIGKKGPSEKKEKGRQKERKIFISIYLFFNVYIIYIYIYIREKL